MATIQELNDKVTELQTSVNTLQDAITADETADQQVITDLTAEVARLQAIIDAGGSATPEELQAVLDGVQAAIHDIQSTTT